MLLKDTHVIIQKKKKTKNITTGKKHHRPLPLPLPLPLLLFLQFFRKNLWTSLHLVINSIRSFNNLFLSSAMIWNFFQRHKLHSLLPALCGVLLLITDHIISKFCFLFFDSQIKEDSSDLFLYCSYLKEVRWSDSLSLKSPSVSPI